MRPGRRRGAGRLSTRRSDQIQTMNHDIATKPTLTPTQSSNSRIAESCDCICRSNSPGGHAPTMHDGPSKNPPNYGPPVTFRTSLEHTARVSRGEADLFPTSIKRLSCFVAMLIRD